jgi:hypothetical protein
VASDFKFVFLNECFHVVDVKEMPELRLISSAAFNDAQDMLLVGGLKGVYSFRFEYIAKYKPALAHKVDMKGLHLKVELKDQA